MPLRWPLILILGLIVATCAACSGSDGPVEGATSPVTILEPQPIARDGDLVDTIDLEGFDENGDLIFGPETVPFSEAMVFEAVPARVTRVQIDYLRNGGFLLYRADIALPESRLLDDPSEEAAELHTTRFSVIEGVDGFALERVREGAPISTEQGLRDSKDAFTERARIKGVCYSPAPINFSNKDAPAVGDLFWDTFDAGGSTIYNWFALWGSGELTPQHRARADLDAIRALGANTVRVYSMISRQLGTDGRIPEPGTGHHFMHEQFLDQAWNNGTKPLHVLIDIPMPASAFRMDIPPAPGEIEFWEATLRETVEDLKDHPAVLGFNIFNEQDAMNSAFPNNGEGPADAATEFFYSQSAKYADMVKQIAPDKLVGWALHDAPDFVKFASRFPDPGPTYMERLSSFDFWGINTYQTLNFDSIFAPGQPGSYGELMGMMRKPVLLTEFGMPATGHDADGQLFEDSTTRQATADFVSRMYPLAFEQELLLGAFYFEFSDEWWKQPPNNPSEWNPGNPAPGFPNGYWDEEGFGLYSSATQDRLPTDSPWAGSGPRLPQDKLTERREITGALRAAFEAE